VCVLSDGVSPVVWPLNQEISVDGGSIIAVFLLDKHQLEEESRVRVEVRRANLDTVPFVADEDVTGTLWIGNRPSDEDEGVLFAKGFGDANTGIYLEISPPEGFTCENDSQCQLTLELNLPQNEKFVVFATVVSFGSELSRKYLPYSHVARVAHLNALDSQFYYKWTYLPGDSIPKKEVDYDHDPDDEENIEEEKEFDEEDGTLSIPKHEFDRLTDNLLLHKKLGRGSFGVVYEAYDLVLHKEVAAKQMNKKHLEELDAGPLDVHQELKALRKLPVHENICGFYRSFETVNDVWLVLEKCGVVSLYDKAKSGQLSESDLKHYMREVVQAQIALHKAGVYQLDIKLTNMMITKDNHIKLIDFGLAVLENTPLEYKVGADGYYTYEMGIMQTYLPSSVDAWGDGVCIFKALFGVTPFGDGSMTKFDRMVAKLEYSFPPDRPSPSEDLKDLLSRIFKPEGERISLEDMLAHPWINNQ